MARSFATISIFTLVALIISGCTDLGVRVTENGEPRTSFKAENLGGVFRSTDRGQSFKQKVAISDTKTINRLAVRSLQFDPQDTRTLYLLARGRGLWVSYNAGDRWEQ